MRKLLLLLALLGCSALTALSPKPVVPETRPIQYLPGSSFDRTITNGITDADRELYYHMDYGIQYLPTAVFESLKRPTNDTIPRVMDEMFFDHPERFGLVPDYIEPHNPLPIGITSSLDTDYVPMTGINCSACHLSMVSNAQGQFFIIDGGSSRFQINSFIGEMLKSVVATLIDPVEFEAFYERYMIRAAIIDDTQLDVKSQLLSASLKKTLTTLDTKELETNLQSAPPHQSSRKTTLTDGAYPTATQLSTRTGMFVYLTRRFLYLFSLAKYGTNPTGSTVADSGPGRSNPWFSTKVMVNTQYLHSKSSYKVVGGPINTPFVWNYDRQHWIFLLGNTNSMVERNLAQSLALLSSFNPTTFETTASIKKLNSIAQYSKQAIPPTWPEDILGSINQDLANQGKTIFKAECLSCHDPKLDNTTTASATYNYIDANTDANYYFGQIEKLDGKDLFTDILTPFMTKVKTAAVNNENIIDLSPYEQGRSPVVWKGPTSNAIIAKPLMGVWGSAPYMHNGSIPTIRDLLNPPYMRPSFFHIGGFVYNTKDLGYVEDPTVSNDYNFTVSCASCEGNSNEGHIYGVGLTKPEKDALIEFLKAYDTNTIF